MPKLQYLSHYDFVEYNPSFISATSQNEMFFLEMARAGGDPISAALTLGRAAQLRLLFDVLRQSPSDKPIQVDGETYEAFPAEERKHYKGMLCLILLFGLYKPEEKSELVSEYLKYKASRDNQFDVAMQKLFLTEALQANDMVKADAIAKWLGEKEPCLVAYHLKKGDLSTAIKQAESAEALFVDPKITYKQKAEADWLGWIFSTPASISVDLSAYFFAGKRAFEAADMYIQIGAELKKSGGQSAVYFSKARNLLLASVNLLTNAVNEGDPKSPYFKTYQFDEWVHTYNLLAALRCAQSVLLEDAGNETKFTARQLESFYAQVRQNHSCARYVKIILPDNFDAPLHALNAKLAQENQPVATPQDKDTWVDFDWTNEDERQVPAICSSVKEGAALVTTTGQSATPTKILCP